MIEFVSYSDEYKNETINRIADFFGFHSSLNTGEIKLTDNSYKEAENTLSTWLSRDHELYLIKYNNDIVGFLHLWYKGPNVAWIEDIYVDKEYRSRGIASATIRKVENIVKQKPNYTAICMDVAPRNENALRLYNRLGYDSISILTLRKELKSTNERNEEVNFLGLPFKI